MIRQNFEIDRDILVQRCLFLDLTVIKSSFPVIHNVGIYGLLKFENKETREINQFNMNSKHLGTCQFALKLIQRLIITGRNEVGPR